jgi:hypothetical protein
VFGVEKREWRRTPEPAWDDRKDYLLINRNPYE